MTTHQAAAPLHGRPKRGALHGEYGTPTHGLSLVVGAVLGTAPAAGCLALSLVRLLPGPAESRFALGYLAVIPLWCSLLCWAFTFRSARNLWWLISVLTFVCGWIAWDAR